MSFFGEPLVGWFQTGNQELKTAILEGHLKNIDTPISVGYTESVDLDFRRSESHLDWFRVLLVVLYIAKKRGRSTF